MIFIIILIILVFVVIQVGAARWINSQLSRNRLLDIQSQDQVRLLAQTLVNKTEEVARLARLADDNVRKQLHEIHTLVNSDMTTARAEELKRTKELILAKRELVQVQGPKATQLDHDEILMLEDRVISLEQILADRLAQFRLLDDQRGDSSRDPS
jgi:hypothetical protein